MTVECPKCKTRYRVDASLMAAGETSFECCQEDCGHIFVYTPPVLRKENSAKPASATKPLSFAPEPESTWKNEQQIDLKAESSVNAGDLLDRVPAFVRQEIKSPPPAEMEGCAEQTGRAGQNDSDEQAASDGLDGGPVSEDERALDIEGEPPAMPQKALGDGPESNAELPESTPSEPDAELPESTPSEPDAELPESTPSEPDAELPESTPSEPDEDTERVPAAVDSPSADKPPETLLSVRAVLTLIGFFVCGYALLSYAALSYPRQTKLVLEQLPMVGQFFVSEPFSARHMRLDELSGRFWLSKDNRRVFAVAATVLNTASVSAKLVQFEGTLYNGVGKQVGQQRVFCGHEANPALLENLTVRNMSTLQKLVPPEDFHIPAGQAAKCLLIFTRPPGSVSEISGRVVAVQFEDVQGMA